MGIETPSHKKNQATIKRDSEKASTHQLSVRKKLIEKGAAPELVRKAKGSWAGEEDQAIKTYDSLKGN